MVRYEIIIRAVSYVLRSHRKNSENSSSTCVCVWGKVLVGDRWPKSNLESFHIICRGVKTNKSLSEYGQVRVRLLGFDFCLKMLWKLNFSYVENVFWYFCIKNNHVFNESRLEFYYVIFRCWKNDNSENVLNVCCIECGMEIQIHTKSLSLSLYGFYFLVGYRTINLLLFIFPKNVY